MTATNTPWAPDAMRALVLADYGTMAVEELVTPQPGPGEALLRILYTGICGSDLHGYTGENGRRIPGQVMGHETAARLIDVGEGSTVECAEPGDLVTFNPTISCGHCAACRVGNGHICVERRVIGVDPSIASAFAQYMTVPVANVVPLPAGMPGEHGALVEPLAVGYHAARRGGVAEGHRVLVIGAGPIGQASALAARRLGASRVVVSETSPARRELIAGLGFETVDPLGPGPHAADLLERSADVTLDAVGSSATLSDALAATALGGTVVLVGMQAPEVHLSAYAISTAERSILGAFCYTDSEFRETAAWAARSGELLDPLISRIVGLDGAPHAFSELASSPENASKILVRLED